LESAAQGTDSLTHLANQLLSLARVENGARAIAEGGAQRLDLSQLARELGMAMAPWRTSAAWRWRWRPRRRYG
jgi:two-component system sensor histidine kinase TctE